MSVKKYTYSLRLIRADYTYTVEQIADLFGVDIATVRRWIAKEGLARIPKARPHLVHSSALLTFLAKKKSARKQPCQPDQVYCFTCKAPRVPAIGTGTARPKPNGSILFQAHCATCGGAMGKVIGAAAWTQNHPLGAYTIVATKHHKEGEDSPLKCQLQTGEQLCLNITH